MRPMSQLCHMYRFPHRYPSLFHSLGILFCSLFLVVSCTGCRSASVQPVTGNGFYFDTIINITVYDTNTSLANDALEQCFELAQQYENLFSRTVEGSDVWNINHAQGKPVNVHPETLDLLQSALDYAELTDGQVDPTIATLSALWNFSENNVSADSVFIPDALSIQQALSHVDYRKVQIDTQKGSVTMTDPAASLDLGFIAKGYIADKMRSLLLSCGVEHALLDLGGNILAVGGKPDSKGDVRAFQIGIRKPFSEEGEALLVLPVIDKSVVSSGNYERYFEKDGIIYHHILDTSTGYPVQNHLLQVTILSDLSLEGDALSTTCYVLGLEKGMHLIESIPNVEAIFVTDDYELHYSSGIEY